MVILNFNHISACDCSLICVHSITFYYIIPVFPT
nr:MAG TPA_asm: hypothetical protein [Caudoviricetes sp.]